MTVVTTSNWKNFYSGKYSLIVYRLFRKKYVVPMGRGNSFFGHGKVVENHCWKRVVTLLNAL